MSVAPLCILSRSARRFLVFSDISLYGICIFFIIKTNALSATKLRALLYIFIVSSSGTWSCSVSSLILRDCGTQNMHRSLLFSFLQLFRSVDGLSFLLVLSVVQNPHVLDDFVSLHCVTIFFQKLPNVIRTVAYCQVNIRCYVSNHGRCSRVRYPLFGQGK